jgi:DNA-binding NarL/FixJ family response regulator
MLPMGINRGRITVVSEKAGERDSSEKRTARIHICGPSSMQNHLLAHYLEEKTGLPARASGISEAAEGALCLRDCVEMDGAALRDLCANGAESQGGSADVVLFNVDPSVSIEIDALTAGYKGIFYSSDTADILARGVGAILGGELWFSRRTFTRCVKEMRLPQAAQKVSLASLTPREIEVLGLLALGASNEMIADKFCISTSTVKTHLYRIYRKIEVSNRLQAVFWANHNL